jgi:hypothetical protein
VSPRTASPSPIVVAARIGGVIVVVQARLAFSLCLAAELVRFPLATEADAAPIGTKAPVVCNAGGLVSRAAALAGHPIPNLVAERVVAARLPSLATAVCRRTVRAALLTLVQLFAMYLSHDLLPCRSGQRPKPTKSAKPRLRLQDTRPARRRRTHHLL